MRGLPPRQAQTAPSRHRPRPGRRARAERHHRRRSRPVTARLSSWRRRRCCQRASGAAGRNVGQHVHRDAVGPAARVDLGGHGLGGQLVSLVVVFRSQWLQIGKVARLQSARLGFPSCTKSAERCDLRAVLVSHRPQRSVKTNDHANARGAAKQFRRVTCLCRALSLQDGDMRRTEACISNEVVVPCPAFFYVVVCTQDLSRMLLRFLLSLFSLTPSQL